MSLPLKVEIVTGASAGACDAGCGVDWNLPQNLAAAKEEAHKRFGPRVRLSLCSISSPCQDGLPTSLQQQIEGGVVLLPVLLVKGEPRISGYFDMRMMLDVIEAALEADHA
ncbi:MAG: hypothetical protein HYX90_08545 [Chloroflexi bacterium]|nr:hypothetical protein [Chloroflexota bacterium]